MVRPTILALFLNAGMNSNEMLFPVFKKASKNIWSFVLLFFSRINIPFQRDIHFF